MDMNRNECCSIEYDNSMKEIFKYVRDKENNEISYVRDIEKQKAVIENYVDRVNQLENIETKYKRCCRALDVILHIIEREENNGRTSIKSIKEIKQVLMEIR